MTSLEPLRWTDCDFNSAQDVQVLRTAAHNILYVVANSNSMNVDIIGYSLEWWITGLIVIDVLVPAALIVWSVFVVRKARKKCVPEGADDSDK